MEQEEVLTKVESDTLQSKLTLDDFNKINRLQKVKIITNISVHKASNSLSKQITDYGSISTQSSESPSISSLYRKVLQPQSTARCLTPPSIWPKPGNLVFLKPRLIKSLTSPLPDHKKNKIPRFVPCEPYVGAVTPLTNSIQSVYKYKVKKKNSITEANENIPKVNADEKLIKKGEQKKIVSKETHSTEDQQNQCFEKKKACKNNIDINVLVRQMSNLRAQEMQGNLTGEFINVQNEGGKQQCLEEMHQSSNTNFTDADDNSKSNTQRTGNECLEELHAQIQKLTDERNYYQNQFKFQAQVNGELKNLLVASVGEDVQTRVNVLTEDKLQLAKALLDTAKHLSTHTEQIEFLAGQCEVWRSKFLATSVMVEELARWKADLSEKNELLTNSTRKLLAVVQQIREMQLELVKNLKFVGKVRELILPATDAITLSAENLNISQQLVLHSGFGMPQDKISTIAAHGQNLVRLCDAERYALQALDFISQPLMATDEAIKALFGQTQKSYSNNGLNREETDTSFPQTDSTQVI